MRTTLDLPANLVEQARESLGFRSKTDTVVFALREVVRRSRLDELKSLMGRVSFEFDPAELRKNAALAEEAGALVWSLDKDFVRMSALKLVRLYG